MIATFFATLSTVAILLLVAAVGFIMMKGRVLTEDFISQLSKLLLFVCQPCLAVYTFASADFSLELLKNIGIFLLLAIAIHAIMLGLSSLVLRRKFKDAAYRILTISTSFANCAFFGIPIIEAVLPEAAAGIIIYTTVYATVMNVLGWTVGYAVISGDVKYISLKKALINPTMLGVVIALPIFFFSVALPSNLMDIITVTARMSTPVSMLIIGMRLATTDIRTVFGFARSYVAVFAKGFVMPLFAFLTVYFLPIPYEIKLTFYIICACPTASIVLNFSEIVGAGQKEAASSVLLSTLLSVVTLPTVMLLAELLK